MLSKLMLAMIPLLGFIGGIILQKIAKEEITPGKKYLILLRHAVRMAMVIILLSLIKMSIITLVVLVLGLVLGRFIQLPYLYMGLAVACVLPISLPTATTLAGLVTVHTLPFATQLAHQKKAKKLMRHALLYVMPILVSSFISFNAQNHFLLAFIAGALIWEKTK